MVARRVPIFQRFKGLFVGSVVVKLRFHVPRMVAYHMRLVTQVFNVERFRGLFYRESQVAKFIRDHFPGSGEEVVPIATSRLTSSFVRAFGGS